MLERTAAAMPEVIADTRVAFGNPADALIAVGVEENAEPIVVGARGRSPLASVLLGSVSARLTTVAPCPVLVVPSPDAADRWLARPSRSRVVCAVDDSVGSIRALRTAAVFAERFGLDLAPVHVDTDNSWEDAPLGPPRGALSALTIVRGEPRRSPARTRRWIRIPVCSSSAPAVALHGAQRWAQCHALWRQPHPSRSWSCRAPPQRAGTPKPPTPP